MPKSLLLRIISYIFILGLVVAVSSCGGSNLNNPMTDSDSLDDKSDADDTDDVGGLDVTVNVTKETVRPGEQVDINATVQGVRGTSVTLNWLNITGYGTLSSENDLAVTWTAPDTLNGENTKVEVLQLVVTVISEIVAVNDSEIQTETQIISDTTEILLKVVSE